MNALTVSGTQSVEITITPDSRDARDSALVFSRLIATVNTPEECQAAADAIRDLRGISNTVEKSRTEVKRPVLDLGKKIDDIAKEFVAPVNSEIGRLSSLCNDYQRRLEDERRKAEKLRQEAEEKARKEAAAAAEAAKQAAQGDDPFAAAEAQAAANQAAQQARATVIATAPAIAQRQPEGMHVRRQPDFAIIDALALAKARPEFVTITPNRAAILAELRRLKEWEGKKMVIAGLEAWWDGKVVVR